MGVVQHISRFCHSSLQINAMSMHTLAVTANEKNRRSYRNEKKKKACTAVASKLMG